MGVQTSPSPPASERVVTLQNAAVATGNGTAITFTTLDTEVLVKVAGASAVLTYIHEVSYDGGTTYVNAFLEDLLAAAGIGTLINTSANPVTLYHRYRRPPGATNFRSRISAYVSGSVTTTATIRSGG